MIRFHGIHKSYKTHFGEREVLAGVDCTFHRGEKVGILGRNGAGKTTLLRLIAGVEHPNRGHVERGMSVSWPLGFSGGFGVTGGLGGSSNVNVNVWPAFSALTVRATSVDSASAPPAPLLPWSSTATCNVAPPLYCAVGE